MKIYNYSNINGEYLGYEDAIKDPMDKGRFLIPSFATTTLPPDVLPDTVACFVDEKWEIVSDFRGKKQISKNDLNISVIDYIGDLKDSFYQVSDAEIDSIKNGKIPCFDGDKLTLSDRPLNDIKTDKKQQVNLARNIEINSESIEYNNDTFDITESSLSIITAKMILAKENTEKTFIYRSKTNQNHEFLGSDIINIWQKINDKIESIYQKSWDLKTKIDNANSIDELNEIVI